MTPVNLGDLPSDKPVPTGLVQLKRGKVGSGVYPWADWSIMTDQNGSPWPMQVEIMPTRPGWWIIRAETIFSIADAAWYYFNWFVRCSPPDANSIQDEYNYHRLHSALSWQQGCIDTAFKLNAGQYYTASMYMGGRQGGSVSYWSGDTYTYIKGEFIAEGSL